MASRQVGERHRRREKDRRGELQGSLGGLFRVKRCQQEGALRPIRLRWHGRRLGRWWLRRFRRLRLERHPEQRVRARLRLRWWSRRLQLQQFWWRRRSRRHGQAARLQPSREGETQPVRDCPRRKEKNQGQQVCDLHALPRQRLRRRFHRNLPDLPRSRSGGANRQQFLRADADRFGMPHLRRTRHRHQEEMHPLRR